ncbi:hypothetical protein EI42_05266 [Thermosporothrix hazakensis]|jgi:hypothetical protein|uniref:Uncharacterized protein n=2 Tax=Thermosporothrix TaxID=768650 RepID=A0A326TZP2_THEHA|nr:hypothetical protein [Thermosporothrix hazakensis]PZW22920.1 hypothetical protein EI42_05266 [Thermosporothrix hazakensis]BBH89802.1 hypothetical protein KTC_45530 [Thermosporothrix sp. COM3]GCE47991.1 hypothetical protein KTH_28600 [Thermosporothrix hazakensis]
MEPEPGSRLHYASKQQLLHVLEVLLARHPELQAEVAATLHSLDAQPQEEDAWEAERTLDAWDDDEVIIIPSQKHPSLPPMDLGAYRQRIDNYPVRLEQKESLKVLRADLVELLHEAELRTVHYDYYNALGLYALILDARLSSRNTQIDRLFDEVIDEFIPSLAALLSEASNSVGYDTSFRPLLSDEERTGWLKRLFAFWLKRLEQRRGDDELVEIMYDMAWNSDADLLRQLAEEELSRLKDEGPSNIVDFSRQYRTRLIERFLHGIPFS